MREVWEYEIVRRPQSRVRYNIHARRIVLRGNLGKKEAGIFEKALEQICKKDKESPVGVFISSSGGDFFACLKIYSLINKSTAPVFTVALTFVSSGAFLITQGGKERFAFKNTKLLFHNAVASGPRLKKIDQTMLLQTLHELCTIDAMQMLIFSERGRPIPRIRRLFRTEAILSAAEAKKLRLVDHVIPQGNIISAHRRTLKIMQAQRA